MRLYCALCLCAALAGGARAAAPSTFGVTVGHALLCLNQLDEAWYYDYLQNAFGKPYKREGGAWWFKSDASLWGAPVTDVLVSEPNSDFSFLAAVVDVTPEVLSEAVQAGSGIPYAKVQSGPYPMRQSNPGSQIIYFQRKAKIFCAKNRFLRPW
ncbi:hypothetical protein V8J88_18805 [Massilia sp. W12]|uniref:hypothetical protein n=1 Tax=Massilia sp. W12 TaxID=3126507 RepID=UPI0030CB0B09